MRSQVQVNTKIIGQAALKSGCQSEEKSITYLGNRKLLKRVGAGSEYRFYDIRYGAQNFLSECAHFPIANCEKENDVVRRQGRQCYLQPGFYAKDVKRTPIAIMAKRRQRDKMRATAPV